jgi:competence protein ComEC
MKELTRSEQLRIGMLCLLFGIFVMRIPEATPWILLFTLFCIGLFIVWQKKILIFITLILAGAGFSGIYIKNQKHDSFQNFWNKNIEINGWAQSAPDEREKDTRITIQGTIQNQQGKILLILPPETKIAYGDSVKVTGRLLQPENFSGFNYQAYLERLGISGIIKKPNTIEIDPNQKQGLHIFLWGSTLREKLRKNLEKGLPFTHSKIAMGILLGVKSELPQTIKESFQRSGLMHILVVSGFNVSVVVLIVAFGLRSLGQRAVFIGTLISLLFFLTLTGLDPPVLRAVLMGGMTAWAVGMGRKTDVRNVILLSILIISLHNPLLLQRDIGFFLSIFATLGILFGCSFVEKKLHFVPSWIRTILAVTIAAQVAVSGILILFFEQLPMVGLLANLLTEPLIPFAMASSFLVTILGWLPTVITKIISIPAIMSIELIIQIAHFLGKVPPLILPSWTGYTVLIPTLAFFGWKFFEREKENSYDPR